MRLSPFSSSSSFSSSSPSELSSVDVPEFSARQTNRKYLLKDEAEDSGLPGSNVKTDVIVVLTWAAAVVFPQVIWKQKQPQI